MGIVLQMIRRCRYAAAVATFLAILVGGSGCSVPEIDDRLWTMWSNMAYSHPVWAGIYPTDRGLKLMLANVETGAVSSFAFDGVRINAIQGLYGKPGQFVVTAITKNMIYPRYFVGTFDYFTSKLVVAHKADTDMRFPFALGEHLCSLVPTKRSTKQVFDFIVFCDGKMTGARIESASSTASGNNHAVIIDNRGSRIEFYYISLSGGTIKLNKNKIHLFTNIKRVIFDGKDMILRNTTKRDGKWTFDLYHVDEFAGVSLFEGPYNALIERCPLPLVNKILSLGDDGLVAASRDEDAHAIMLHVCDAQGKKTATIKVKP